jgi:hypothetical protein
MKNMSETVKVKILFNSILNPELKLNKAKLALSLLWGGEGGGKNHGAIRLSILLIYTKNISACDGLKFY